MMNFIESYLQNPSEAISAAQKAVNGNWFDTIDDELIYQQLSSPEFRLYEEMCYLCAYDRDDDNMFDNGCGAYDGAAGLSLDRSCGS